MGAGSSKSNNQNSAGGRGRNADRSVANVNNDGGTGFPQREVKESKTDERGTSNILGDKDTNIDYVKDNNFGRHSPLKPIEPNKKDKEKKSKEKNANGSAVQSRNSRSNVSALVFENDSDFDDDIDEVLRIPVAADTSKKEKEKKNKKKEKSNNAENEFYERRNDNDNGVDQDVPLPETYAQRLQRKQYKVQQDLLLREKTIMRNSLEWDRNDDKFQEEDRGLEMEVDSPRKGFDASKFRAANKGQDVKKELFTTVPDDLQTPRYLQTTGQDLDEVDVERGRPSPNKQLPHYNQSELDLMQQLEDEIL